MRKPYAKKIDARTTELLRSFDLFGVPVDVKTFAERLGATVIFDELEEDVSGLLLREKNVATIAVNQKHHPNRQRFTIAHECGHLHLHADQGDRLWVDRHTTIFYRNAGSSSGDQKAEIEANQFAAGLLMPEKLLLAHVTDEMSDVDIFRLALRFQVSEQAMMLRLASLDVLETT
jgi:Zn-dependent peptidase ImmA (M78 family)